MQTQIDTPAGTVRVGTKIRIDKMQVTTTPSKAFPDGIDHSADSYNGREGTVNHIDGSGQLFGTWGGLAVIPEADKFTIIG